MQSIIDGHCKGTSERVDLALVCGKRAVRRPEVNARRSQIGSMAGGAAKALLPSSLARDLRAQIGTVFLEFVN